MIREGLFIKLNHWQRAEECVIVRTSVKIWQQRKNFRIMNMT